MEIRNEVNFSVTPAKVDEQEGGQAKSSRKERMVQKANA